MSPAFYSKNLHALYPIFASAAERLVERWKRNIHSAERKGNGAGAQFRIEDLSLELKKAQTFGFISRASR
jgi:hypothetical protein